MRIKLILVVIIFSLITQLLPFGTAAIIRQLSDQDKLADARTGQKKSIDPNIPIANYDAVVADADLNPATQQIRKQKNAFYHREDTQPLRDPGRESNSYPAPDISHMFIHFPALPVKRSDAVIIGRIKESEAILTEDKKFLYSEFTVDVEQVLKSKKNVLSVGVGQPLVAERYGGAVRFPSGVIWEFRHQDLNYPRVGDRYVLFLSREGPQVNVIILTGYELLNEKVIPLDDAQVFKAFQGQSESFLITALVAEIKKKGR
jgi:hypothetical protein